jgi:hypothetical protein
MEGLGATVDGRDIGSGTVLLMLRTDFAGKDLGLFECARSAGSRGGN